MPFIKLLLSLLCVALVACGDDTSGNDNLNNQAGRCGDGTADVGEECDEGTANSDTTPDACRTSCRAAYCGDEITDTGEACDDGLRNGRPSSTCKVDCTINVCGDGVLGLDEVCDDGNTVSHDGCRGDCQMDETLCGNGRLDAGEDCDLGTLNSDDTPDSCRTDCRAAHCGDSVQDSTEACDDGNTENDLDCSADCRNYCGDQALNPHLGEECDEGRQNGVAPSACRADCRVTTCGDGYIGGDEGCDDSNATDGDGCSATCQVEPRYQCSGVPSSCECAGPYGGPGCSECVVFVSLDATPSQSDGLSWATAFTTVQEGVDLAYVAGPGCEVWVQQGTYHVFEQTRRDTLELRSGVALYGGFGGTEAQRADRDPVVRPTILTGRSAADPEVRVVTVVTAISTIDATIDGFTITGGQANGLLTEDKYGGGLYADGSTLHVQGCQVTDNYAVTGGGMALYAAPISIQGCTFSNNEAKSRGGAIYSYAASPRISDSTFSQNTADNSAGICNEQGSSPIITRCLFEENSGSFCGAVCSFSGSSPVITDSRFHRNSGQAGAIHTQGGSTTVTGCLFAGNFTDISAVIWLMFGATMTLSDSVFTDNRNSGADRTVLALKDSTALISDVIFTANSASPIYLTSNGHVTITGSTISGNQASWSGGIRVSSSSLLATNCVLAGNGGGSTGGALRMYTATATITNSTIVGNYASSQGGGLWADGSTTTITNSIVWGNSAPDGPTIYERNGATFLITYSDVEFEGDDPANYSIDADPVFVAGPTAPAHTGTWFQVDFDDVAYQTRLTDSSASWTPGELIGLFVRPDLGDLRWFEVVDNTDTELVMWGNLTSFVEGGDVDTYEIYDLHLATGSPCIDTGDDNAPERMSTDIDGVTWADVANVGTENTETDMGAYEHVP